MPKRKRTEAARKGWKRRCNKEREVKKRKLWNDSSMIEAMEAVKAGRLGVNRAAEEYNVPKTTLQNRLSGRVKHGTKSGPGSYLTSSEETELAKFLIDVCKMGHGKTKREVIDIVKRTVKKKMENKGKDFDSCKFKGEGWWQGFIRRQFQLSLRSSDGLSRCRANAVDQESIDYYFSLLKKTLEDNDLFNKACYIYNMDETGMPLDHKQPKRIAPKGMKKVYGPSSGNKCQITILACSNATGTVLPPMIIFKGERLNYEWTKGEIPNTVYGMSPQGWINHELFAEWLEKLFIKNIPQTRPVILLLDGHSSHFTPEAIKIAGENEIILFCLPPNATHVAQPLDVSFFGPLKKHWYNVCHTYMNENPGKVVTKFQFCALLHEAWFQSIQPETIKAGFRKSGIYPFDATAIKPLISASDQPISSASNDETISLALENDQPISSTSINDQATSSVSVNNQATSSASVNDQATSSASLNVVNDLTILSKDQLASSYTMVSGKDCSYCSDTSFEESISFTEDQVTLFERRYDNGYNLYHDKMYVAWLQQEHPECVPNDLAFVNPNSCPVTENTNTGDISQSESSLESASENLSQSSVQESPAGVQVSTSSLSVSLSQTRGLLSELSEFLNQPKVPVKAKGKTTKARVLTSAESLSLLIEKERKKKEEEEAKAKRKEEREKKRKEKEAEKQSKSGNQRNKKVAKKPSMSKRSTKKTPVASPSDSDSQDEDGIQSKEISSNECAICFGLYQDDLSSTGKLLTEWVECPNIACKKWMHIQCLQLSDGLYVCGLCSAQFS